MTFDFEQFEIEQRKQKETLETACSEATAVFQKHFPTEDGNLYAPIALASCIELFDIEDSKDVGQLYLEWVVEHYVGRKVCANIDDVKRIVEILKEKGCTEDDPYVFNDMDNTLFYLSHKSKLIFCSTSQNTRYIYILNGHKFHIRRYYDEYDFDGEEGDWRRDEDEAAYKKHGIREAIASAAWLNEEWSDCLPDNPHPRRLSLQALKDCDFEPRYGDCRDNSYVLSYDDFMGNPRVDRALFFYSEIKTAFFDLRHAVEVMETL
jgi:hypothetical protein